MGVANVIPGLSGGTLLLLTGIYPRFIEVFGSFQLKSPKDYKWKANILFMIILALGALLSIFAMSKIMSWLLESYHVPVYLILIGLIIGSIDMITKKIDFKSVSNRYALIAGIGLIIFFVILGHFINSSPTANGDVSFILLITAGALAAATMVLPGVSGSMLLLLVGLYKPVVDSVSSLNIGNILFIGVGAVIGILIASRLIKSFLAKHTSATYAFLLGLI